MNDLRSAAAFNEIVETLNRSDEEFKNEMRVLYQQLRNDNLAYIDKQINGIQQSLD